MKIDPNKTWKLVEARLEFESDPVLRRNLQLVLDHMKAEARGDIEGVVATLCEAPRYITHAVPGEVMLNPEGSRDAVRKFYDLTIIQTGAHQLELDCDRVIVDRDSVFTEGVMRIAYPGKTLQGMGIEIDDPDAYYVYEARMAVVWPVDSEEEKLVGEETYTGTDGFAGIADRKISQADIVPLEI